MMLVSHAVNGDEKKDILSNLKQTLAKQNIANKKAQETKTKIKKLTLNLRNPTFSDGILSTKDGGVICSSKIRIQARNIQYVKRKEKDKLIHTLVADRDLLVTYQDHVFAGDKIEFDFVKQEGTIYNATTFRSPWYLSGDRIDLKSDGTYHINNVSITSCENVNSSWDIHAQKVDIQNDTIAANNIKFRFFNIPVLWIPSFSINLKKYFAAPVLRYKIDWDKANGPKIGIRYRAYSYEDFALFLRFEYRLKKGPGGTLEAEYFPSDSKTAFVTKNYLAKDILTSDPQLKKRYRVQGFYNFATQNDRTSVHLTWDKFSDIHMPGDFIMDDFEASAAKRTEFNFRHQEDAATLLLHARPRVNTFETIKEDLPTIYCGIRPFKIPGADIMMSNWTKASFLRMAYSNHLQTHLRDYHSGRFQTLYELYRPFYIGLFKFIPSIYATGVLYTNTPNQTMQGQASINCNCLVNTSLQKSYSRQKHIVEPYMDFSYFSPPLLNMRNQYIFSIQDGFHKLAMLKIGIKNSCFSIKNPNGQPSFNLDIFANTFLEKNIYFANKIYCYLSWNLPSISFDIKTAFNVKLNDPNLNNVDFANIAFGYTINEDAAISLEWRYRSSYDFRKADHDSFILESIRSFQSLLSSPLSDRRQTLLTRMFFRLTPHWTCNIESHHGWDRISEPFYNEFKIDAFTMLSSSWKFRISYVHTQTDDQFSCGISLIRF
jgi:hypothetical protein